MRTAIKNSGGINGSLLIPEAPFELLVRRAIERLLPPALQVRLSAGGVGGCSGVRRALFLHCAPLVSARVQLVTQPCPPPRPPLAQCKDFVHAELLRIAAQCSPPDVARFPVLQVCAQSCSAACWVLDASAPVHPPARPPCR